MLKRLNDQLVFNVNFPLSLKTNKSSTIGKKVTEKIHEKYEELEFVVSLNSEIELYIKVKENEENFNLVKKDIESIAKSEIKSSSLKEYTVVVERLDLSFVNEEVKNRNKENLHLSSALIEGLKDYDVLGNINTEYLKSITIHTSIKGSDNDAHKLAMEIEETVNEILHTKELNSVSHIDSYEIKILNINGKVVN
ncbi:DUF4030 domain-containing protein [Paenisporosarcina sp. TG20]|uniref:DUF4030 domain-containing protein n=1 Tax=Paenisporosarcina sp. TG20 TaxID=1211706 RepID=UPI0002D53C7C|nr:DUF4030 domain-containing protein [Paenisporosarcina sp. TG20]